MKHPESRDEEAKHNERMRDLLTRMLNAYPQRPNDSDHDRIANTYRSSASMLIRGLVDDWV